MNSDPGDSPTLTRDSSHAEENLPLCSSISDERARLVQLIAKLLARQWLRESHQREPTYNEADNRHV
jgi:hypothetical protein